MKFVPTSPRNLTAKQLSIALGVALLWCAQAQAATDSWSGATNANWSGLNWAGTGANNPPQTGDTLIFGTTTGGFTTLNDNLMTPGTFNLAGIIFSVGAPAFTINPNSAGTNGFTLTTSGTITNLGTSLETINDLIALTGTSTITTKTGGGNITLGGVISGSSITVAGSGTLTFTASNTYTGTTNLHAGVLDLGNSGALGGAGSITFTGGTLQYSAANNTDYSGSIVGSTGAIIIDANGQGVSFGTALASSNTGGLTLQSTAAGGSLTLNVANSYSGTTTLTSGTLIIATGEAVLGGNVTSGAIGAGTLLLAPSGAATNELAASGAGGAIDNTVLLKGNNTVFGGAIALVFNQNGGSFSGTGGDAHFTNNDSGGVTLAGPVFLNTTASTLFEVLGSGSTTISGSIANGGDTTPKGLTLNSTSQLILSNGNNIYSGTTTVTTGTLVISANDSVTTGAVTNGPLGTSLLDLAGGVLQASPGTARTIDNTIILAASSTIGGGDNLTFNSLAGSFTNSGGGRTLTVNNTATTTFAGPVYLSEASATGRTFAIAGSGNVTISGPVSNYSGGAGTAGTLSLTNTGANDIESGSIGGTALVSITGAGNWTFSSSNSNFTGGLTVNATGAILQIGANETASGGVVSQGPIGTGTLTLGNATIEASGGARTVTNPILYLNATNYTIAGSNNLTLAGPEGWNGSQTLTVSNTGLTTLSGVFTLRNSATDATPSAQRTLTIAGTGNVLVSGSVVNGTSLNGLVTITDSGTVTLSNNNTFTGAIGVSNGTLMLGNANGLGFGGMTNVTGNATVNSAATLDLNGQTGVTKLITINGTGVGGNGALINSNAGTSASIGSGVYSLALTGGGSGYSALPTVTISGSGSGATAVATLGLTVTSLGYNANGSTYSTAPTVTITGGGGTGAVATVSKAGVLTLGDPGVGYTSTPTIVVSGGVLTAGSGVTFTPNATNFAVVGIQVTNSGTGYYGATTATIGAGATTATATVSNSSVALGSAGSNSIGGAGNITIYGQVTGGATSSFTKVGSDTVTLANVNSYTGTTTISSGILQLGDGTTGHDGTINSSLNIVNSSALVYDRFGSSSYSGTISGNGTVTMEGGGTQILTGVNGYTGSTTIASGTLQLGDGTTGHDGAIDSSAGILNNGALVYNRFGSDTYSGPISGAGTVTMLGSGTQTLSGSNSYSGNTAIEQGNLSVTNTLGSASGSGTVNVAPNQGAIATLSGNGTIGGPVITAAASGANIAHIAPGVNSTGVNGNFGGIGTLTLGNGLTIGNGTNLDFDLGASSDLIAITGTLSLGSNLVLNISQATGFTTGVTYNLISYTGSVSGTSNLAAMGALVTGASGDVATFGATGASGGDITVTFASSNNSTLTITPSPISLGSVLVGSTPASVSGTLANNGSVGSATYTTFATGSATAAPANGSLAPGASQVLTVGAANPITGPSGNNVLIGTVGATNSANTSGSATPVNVTANLYEVFSGSESSTPSSSSAVLNLTTLANDDGAGGQRAGVTINGWSTTNGNFAVSTDNGGVVGTASGGANSATADVGTVAVAANRLSGTYNYTGTITGSAQYSDPALQSQGGGSLANPQWSGVSISGTVVANYAYGQTGTAAIGSGSSFAGYGLTSSQGDLTQAQMLSGSSSAAINLTMQFTAHGSLGVNETGSPSPYQSSDTLTLGGLNPTGGTGPDGGSTTTDAFVLQLGVTTNANVAGGSYYLGWWDPAANGGSGSWVNAIAGNSNAVLARDYGLTGAYFTGAGGGFANGSYAAYLAANGFTSTTPLSSELGAYGYDVTDGVSWAVLNYDSDIEVIPEPGTYAMIFSGFGMLIGFRSLRKRRSSGK